MMKLFAFGLVSLMAFAPTTSAETREVSWGFVFEESVTVNVGDTVKWVWDQNPAAHDVVSGSGRSPDGLFKSALQGLGSEFSHTFDEAGEFAYYCTPHFGMQAVIIVVPAKNIVQLAVGTPDLSTLVTALTAATLTDTLSGAGPFTVFAPTNDAFAKLDSTVLSGLLEPASKDALINVLTYHVANGDVPSSSLSNGQKIPTLQGSEVEVTITATEVKINTATVTMPDISASNGVVHLINAVLIPAPSVAPEPEPQSALNIVELAVDTPDLSSLVFALDTAMLVDTLSGPGPFTVFAPTNDAFAMVDRDTVDSLFEPANVDALANVLTYHVAVGSVYAGELFDGQMIKTVQGSEVEVTINEEGVFINNAKVSTADITASNGVVHLIDNVLIPKPAPTLSPTASPATLSPTSSGSISVCKGLKKKKCKKQDVCAYVSKTCVDESSVSLCGGLTKKKCKKQDACAYVSKTCVDVDESEDLCSGLKKKKKCKKQDGCLWEGETCINE